jgi:hypothetical protein
MPVFLVVPLASDVSPLNEAVEAAFGTHDRYKLSMDRGWLVNYNGTSRELSDLLHITGHSDGDRSRVGSAIITPIASYYGLGAADMWEWLALKLSS